MQIERSSSSERWVSRRASTTSTGKRPTNGFPWVDVGEAGGVDSTGLGFLMAGAGCVRGAVEAFLERRTRFLRVAGDFGGGVFGCREARPLRERRVARAREGGGLAAEEGEGMVRRS